MRFPLEHSGKLPKRGIQYAPMFPTLTKIGSSLARIVPQAKAAFRPVVRQRFREQKKVDTSRTGENTTPRLWSFTPEKWRWAEEMDPEGGRAGGWVELNRFGEGWGRCGRGMDVACAAGRMAGRWGRGRTSGRERRERGGYSSPSTAMRRDLRKWRSLEVNCPSSPGSGSSSSRSGFAAMSLSPMVASSMSMTSKPWLRML